MMAASVQKVAFGVRAHTPALQVNNRRKKNHLTLQGLKITTNTACNLLYRECCQNQWSYCSKWRIRSV